LTLIQPQQPLFIIIHSSHISTRMIQGINSKVMSLRLGTDHKLRMGTICNNTEIMFQTQDILVNMTPDFTSNNILETQTYLDFRLNIVDYLVITKQLV
jgi:hypothetical protein